MQPSAHNETPPFTEPEPRGFKSKASRYFNRTPSFASFKSAPATTGRNIRPSGLGDTDKSKGPIFTVRRSISLLAAKLSFFKREESVIWSCVHPLI